MSLPRIFSRFLSRFGPFALAFALFAPALRAQAGSPSAADGFDPNVNGTVFSHVVQPDGRVVIAGSFTAIRPNGGAAVVRQGMARLNSDGSIDTTFGNPGFNATVNAIALQADGKFVATGAFTALFPNGGAGVGRNFIVRLNSDGSIDPTFGPSLSGSGTALAIQADGGILVGGNFASVQSVPRNRLARINPNGSVDLGFNPNPDQTVLSLVVQPDGRILAGGQFSSFRPNGTGTAIARKRAARLFPDGNVDPVFDPSPNGQVLTFALQPDGNILMGGAFTTIQPNGAPAVSGFPFAVRMFPDGSLDKTFFPVPSSTVNVIRLQADGKILLGGNFASIQANGGSVVARSFIARMNVDGTLDGGFNPTANGAVNALDQLSDGKVVFGGVFTQLKNNGVSSLSTTRNHYARVNADGSLDTAFEPATVGRITSIATQPDGKIVLSGNFLSVGGLTRNFVARLNAVGGVDPAFAPLVDGVVNGIAVQADGKVMIVGGFQNVNGVVRRNVARLNADGSLDAAYDPSPNFQADSVTLQADGKAIIGGLFTQFAPNGATETTVRNFIARVNTDGTLDPTFDPNTNSTVAGARFQPDGKIIIYGGFTGLGPFRTPDSDRDFVARLNTDGTLDRSFIVHVASQVNAFILQADGKFIVGGNFTSIGGRNDIFFTPRSRIGRFNADGTVDTGYDPGANAAVNVMTLQADGKVIVGGAFTQIGGVARMNIARLNEDGSVDTTFNPNPDGQLGTQVNAIAVEAGGKVIFSGSFGSLAPNGGANVPRTHLARVNGDGTIDASFDTGIGGQAGVQVNAFVQQPDGKVIAAGAFAGLGGSTSSNLARFNLDGTPDFNFNPSPNGPVSTIAILRGINTQATSTTNFAWLNANGTLHSGFNPGADVQISGPIYVTARQPDGKFLIGGAFRNLTGTTGNNLVRFNADGTLDTGFSARPTTQVNAISLLPNGQMIVAGGFETIGGGVRANIARLNSDGSFDPTFFNSAPNGLVVQAIVQPDGKILIAGNFSSAISGSVPASGVRVTRNLLARLNVDGTLDDAFNPGVDGTINAMLLQPDGRFIVGGSFSNVQGAGSNAIAARRQLARFNADGSLDSSWDPNRDDQYFATIIFALAQQADGKLLVGGQFPTINNVNRAGIARLNADGQVDPTFDPGANDFVTSISLQADGKAVVAGRFTRIAGITRNHIARLNTDGTIDAAFNLNVNGDVNTVFTASDGTLLVGGEFNSVQPNAAYIVGGTFTSIGGRPGTNLAMLNSDGTAGIPFQPNPDGVVSAVAVQADGKALVGGAFTITSGVARLRLARYNADNTLDAGFDPGANGPVNAIVVQADGKIIVGGAFTQIAGTSRNNIARLNSDGTIDASYNPGADGAVNALAIESDGRLLAGGAFGTIGGAAMSRIARLGTSGVADTSFNLNANGPVNAIGLHSDGKIVIGGGFTSIAGGARRFIARVESDGTLDATFDPDSDGTVLAVTVETDGRTLVGGNFSFIGGRQRTAMARLAATSPATQAFTLSDDLSTLVWTRAGTSPEISGVSLEYSTDNFRWTPLGQAVRNSGTSTWQLTGLTTITGNVGFFVRAQATAPSSQNASSGLLETVTRFYPRPVVTSATTASAIAGQFFVYAISTTNIAYSFNVTGLPAGLTFDPVSGVISGTPASAGTFVVTLFARNGSGNSIRSLTLDVKNSTGNTTDGRIFALSTRAFVDGSNPMVSGFVLSGTVPKSVLVRAVGPGLTSFGVTNAMASPFLQLIGSSANVLASNRSWGGGADLAGHFARLGEFPLSPSSADAAFIVTLQPGVYTAQVVNGSSNGVGGTVLLEVYDAGDSAAIGVPRLIAISTRGLVSGGGNILVGGLAVSGSAPKKFIIRGVGPNLIKAGVGGPVPDPYVSVYSNSNVLLARNDNWETPFTVAGGQAPSSGATIAAAAASVGLAPYTSGSADAALIVTLAPGVYTVEVNSGSQLQGAGMVEIYELP